MYSGIMARVRDVLEQLGTDYSLDEVITRCHGLTRNQVFLAIDDLSRRGQVRVMRDDDGIYRIRLVTLS